jgi:hypothetical protein
LLLNEAAAAPRRSTGEVSSGPPPAFWSSGTALSARVLALPELTLLVLTLPPLAFPALTPPKLAPPALVLPKLSLRPFTPALLPEPPALEPAVPESPALAVPELALPELLAPELARSSDLLFPISSAGKGTSECEPSGGELSEGDSHDEELHVDESHENESASSSLTGLESPTSLSVSSTAAATSSASVPGATLAFTVLAPEAPGVPDDPFVPGFDADDFASVSASASSAADAVIRGGFADRPASSTPSSSVPNDVSIAPAETIRRARIIRKPYGIQKPRPTH